MSVHAIATLVKPGSWIADENSPEYIRPQSVVWLTSNGATMGPYVVMNAKKRQLYDPIGNEIIYSPIDELVFIAQDQISNQRQIHDKDGIRKLQEQSK